MDVQVDVTQADQAQQPLSITTDAMPDVDPARAALVKEWTDRVSKRRKEMEDTVFKQMRVNQEIARRGAEKSWGEDKYTVPITTRVINQSVARLYAKNPTAAVTRNKKLMYKIWDGSLQSLQDAMASVAHSVAPPQPGMMPSGPDPMALQLIQEVQQVVQQEKMLDRMAKSMEILYEYYINEQAYDYKEQIKAAVRRAKVCKVAYCRLDFQRALEPRPEKMAEIEDATSKIATIEARLADMQEGDIEADSAQLEELRLLLQDLQNEPDLIVREGPVLDFPRATSVIIDEDCFHLKSLAGARWQAYEYDMTPERVEEVYKVDIKSNYTKYESPDEKKKGGKPCSKARLYEVWDKKNQQVFTICEGYKDFIKEPATPDVRLERFWTLFPLVFNEVEHDEHIFPQSDVENMKDIQAEYNRSREALREHRIASRPWWVSDGSLQEGDEEKISKHEAHEHVRVAALASGQKIQDKLMAGPTAPIDPNLYQVEEHFTDLQRVGGFQEATLGATAGGTATESSIAEASRNVSDSSDTDDLDEWLTKIAKAMGQLMLMEVDKQTVLEIVGPGAVWPDVPETRTEAAKDLILSIKAGSSGRPNKAAELANIERAAPIVIQIPGFKPEPLARKYCELLDLDYEEAVAEGLPSITAINALMTKVLDTGPAPVGAPGQETGNPATNPAAQGQHGGQNAPRPNAPQPGPQPGYQPPAPVAA